MTNQKVINDSVSQLIINVSRYNVINGVYGGCNTVSTFSRIRKEGNIKGIS